ncbi:carboxypeptidase-like regulatory domain-containing protein [Flavobacterium sp. RHBU_3]|uniref:carboxypeptidase-like regulatory domain-containing protein n=1 Tax=Flavobacterium sp. RHBU_3 TaxID=3391184 RepID=UPI00398523AD
MTPTEKGRFCAACQKQVIDFTKASDREINTAMRQDADLCGRFTTNQLNRDLAITKEKSTVWAAASASFISFLVLGSNKAIAQGSPIKTETSPKEKDVANDTVPKAAATDSIKNLLSGTIVDSMGLGLANTTIENTNKKTRTSTDMDGNFSIKVEFGDEIVISFVGFVNQKIIYSDQQNVYIKMYLDPVLEESLIYDTYGKPEYKRTLFGRIFHKIGNLFR